MVDGRTHWDECWREHRDCAVAKVERLTAETERLTRICNEMARDMDALRAALDDLHDIYEDFDGRVPHDRMVTFLKMHPRSDSTTDLRGESHV